MTKRWGGTGAPETPKVRIVSNTGPNPGATTTHNPETENGAPGNLNDPIERFTIPYIRMMSPRSIEALKQCGAVPKELIERHVEFFVSKIPDDHLAKREVATLRKEHHDRRRKTLIKEGRRKRALLVSQGWVPPILLSPIKNGGRSMATSTRGSPKSVEMFPLVEQPLIDFPLLEAGAVDLGDDLEEERLAKLQERQQKSLERLISYEIKMMKARQEQEAKVKRREKVANDFKAKSGNKMEKLRKKKYDLDQKRKEAMYAQADADKLQAQKDFQEAMKKKKIDDRKAAKAKKKAHKQLMERERQRQEWEDKTRNIARRQQELVASKIAERQMRDAIRERKLKIRREKEQRESAQGLARKHWRAQRAMEKNGRELARKQAEMHHKQDLDNERLMSFKQNKNQQAKQNERRAAALAAKRERARQCAEEEQHRKIKKILDKDAEMERRAAEQAEFEQRERAIREEMKRLRQQEKLDAICRGKRKKDYRKTQILGKIEHQDTKLRMMQKHKEVIIGKRRMAGVNAQMKKQDVLDAFVGLQSSDKMGSVESAAAEMVKLASKFIGDTTELKKRILAETGLSVK